MQPYWAPLAIRRNSLMPPSPNTNLGQTSGLLLLLQKGLVHPLPPPWTLTTAGGWAVGTVEGDKPLTLQYYPHKPPAPSVLTRILIHVHTSTHRNTWGLDTGGHRDPQARGYASKSTFTWRQVCTLLHMCTHGQTLRHPEMCVPVPHPPAHTETHT